MTTEYAKDIARDVARAAAMMDARKPSWWRRIVFKRLDMSMPCDCIAGQSGLFWEEIEDDFEGEFHDTVVAPFADTLTEPYWKDEVRARRAAS